MILAPNHLQPLNGNKMKEIVIVLFVLFGLFGQAQKYAKIGERNGVKYYIHTVTDSQSLYGIQNMYGVPLEEIKSANTEIKEQVNIGQVIYIPILYKEIEHTVQSRETLYGIARKYSVSIDSLKAYNPSLTKGLKRGQSLKIKNLILPIQLFNDGPIDATVNLVEDSILTLTSNDSIIEYTVKNGETLYSISKRFMVPIDVLQSRNNLSNSGLKEGQVITIPLKKEMEIKPHDITVFIQDTIGKDTLINGLRRKDKYEVAVLLPFNLDTLDDTGLRGYAMEYYMGAMLAIDSLRSYSVNSNFRFIDYLSKSVCFDSLLLSSELDSMDLIYAPFDFKMSQKFSAWADTHRVKVVYPLANHHSLGIENDLAYFMNPNTSSLLTVLAKHLSERDSTQIVLIRTNDSTEMIVYDEFLRITQYLDSPVKIQEANFSNYTYFAKKKGMKTAYVLLSKCSPMIEELLKFSSELEHVDIYGLKDWKRCSPYLGSINNNKPYRFANPSFFSYEVPDVKAIHKVYRSAYNADLTRMSCLGFDATLNLFLYALYGIELPQGLVHRFNFETSGVNHINKRAFILEYSNLEEFSIEP